MILLLICEHIGFLIWWKLLRAIIRLRDFRCESKRKTVAERDSGAIVTEFRVNKIETYTVTKKPIIRTDDICFKTCNIYINILIIGTNNVIKLVRFADFSLCRFSVWIDEKYSHIYHCCLRTLSFLNDPKNPYCFRFQYTIFDIQ